MHKHQFSALFSTVENMRLQAVKKKCFQTFPKNIQQHVMQAQLINCFIQTKLWSQ